MRILMLNYEYPPLGGGGGVAHESLAEMLARRHAVMVLTTHFRTLPTRETRNGVQIVRVRCLGRTDLATASIRSMVSFAPAAFAAGLRHVKDFRPDVICAFFAVPSGVPGILLGRAARIPVVLTLVGADVFDPAPTAGFATHRNPLLRAVVRAVIRAADARTAISEDTKLRARAYHGAPSNIDVIPLGLVPPVLPPDLEARRVNPVADVPSLENRPFRFVTVGRLIPRKAHHDLLAALALLRRSRAELHVIGEGLLTSGLQSVALTLGIANRVRFHGKISETEKWRHLVEGDCFVSASLHEGFGIMFLEAMYAGLPVVATNAGGNKDLLLPGINALLVPPNEPSKLAQAMEVIQGDEALRGRMRQANRERVQRYLIERTADRYQELFERVVHARCLARQRPAQAPEVVRASAEGQERPEALFAREEGCRSRRRIP